MPAILEPGLPNVLGSAILGSPGRYLSLGATSGAISAINSGATGGSGSSASASSNCTLSFNAKKSNVIYGNSDTVQPPAIQLIPQIKY